MANANPIPVAAPSAHHNSRTIGDFSNSFRRSLIPMVPGRWLLKMTTLRRHCRRNKIKPPSSFECLDRPFTADLCEHPAQNVP